MEYIQNVPILFTHAGIIPNFYNYLMNLNEIKFQILNKNPNEKIEIIIKYINSFIINIVKYCNHSSLKCKFENPLFEAAPCRGGDGIGGPL